MEKVNGIPNIGQIVRVRQRQYLVEEVIPPKESEDSTLVRLSCIDDDAQGQLLEVLWEKELDGEILSEAGWRDIGQKEFDPPRLFAAYLHTRRWNCVTATDTRLFQSPFRAGIKLDAYQLEPLRKALLLPRVNIFIADDVGLGKTIEAALILRELLLRKKVREVLVTCPPSLLPQWKDELEIRFGLTFEILDREYVQRVRRERGYAVNPWTTHSRFLISQRLLIDETYSAPLRDWLGEFKPGSMFIFDEAHHAAPASGARYAIDSKITRAIRDIAPRFEHRIFLSATPHNGHSNSFTALLELLDPQRFCRGVKVMKSNLKEVMVRRLKEDIRVIAGGFPKRHVIQIDIDGLNEDAPELKLAELLDKYRRLREQRLKNETRKKQAASGLLICGLQQRLLSSVEAFARTLRVHRRTVMKQWANSGGDSTQDAAALSESKLDLLRRPISNDDDKAGLSEEDIYAEEEAQVEAASLLSLGSLVEDTAQKQFKEELALLDQMEQIAEEHRYLPDARIKKLIEWIKENMCPGLCLEGSPAPPDQPPKWNDLRLIIFTEYDDTKRYLERQLRAAIQGTEHASERIRIFHGPTPQEEREEIKRAFNTDPRKNNLRILISTDAGREGLNLQSYCWNLFHFDVPWNPSRLEQRNGRIDRKLQPNPEVFCYYFFYKQRPEDRVLKVLVEKTERIREELGSLSPVLERRLADMLEGQGIKRDSIDDTVKKINDVDLEKDKKETVQDELEETRERQQELRDQIEVLRNRLEYSRKWIRFDEEQFRSAISCAIELNGGTGLKPADGEPSDIPRFVFPALDRLEGGDPSWASTLDTLRPPRKKDQSVLEWRRCSQIRPVVFQDTGSMDESTVHLHLEHRVIQRLFARFIAQGFIHHDLSRACLAHSQDPIPRVVLLGRLALFGPRAARLHEEIIAVAARWFEIEDTRRPLKPLGRRAEESVMQIMENSLMFRSKIGVPPEVKSKLLASLSQDTQELLPELEARAKEIAGEAEAMLRERAKNEAKSMEVILNQQKRLILETQKRYADKQLVLGFNDEETRQLEANRRYWTKRLLALDKEIALEPKRIIENYEIKATRLEPVGIVYLWPITG